MSLHPQAERILGPLREAGVATESRRFDGMFHDAHEAIALCGRALRGAFEARTE